MSQSFPELVRANRSYRSFDPARKVTPEELAYFVSLARITPSAANLQPLRYRLVSGEEMKVLLPCTKWAAALPERHFPPAGHEPTGAVVICHDTAVIPDPDKGAVDRGIAAQTICLAAADRELGCCMIANFRREELAAALAIPAALVPVLVIAIGKPDETVVLEDAAGSLKYYRDAEDRHHVPKRKMEDLIIR